MHLSVHVRYSLKDRPKGMKGLVSENWTFGKKAFLPLATMCRFFLEKVFDWYTLLGEPDELNGELDHLIAWLQATSFQEVEEETDEQTTQTD